ncbi:MAG: DUF4920 domain-containing protein [Chitinophagaceae bacterium]
MKKLTLLLSSIFFLGSVTFAQDQVTTDPVSAQKGVTYGAGTTEQGAISIQELEKKAASTPYEGKVKVKVLDVCLKKGCWMNVENSGGEKMMVKFKDYGFFMPKDIVGKQVILDGEATVEETSVKQLQHYASDAGKSKLEIAKIKTPKKELTFVAKGVLVL